MNDGSMLSTRSGWKEAKLGVLFSEDIEERHDPRRGRMVGARYVAVLGEQEEFYAVMKAALDAEAWSRRAQVVWLGDGARGNWILAERLCPTAIQILDIQHAVQHGVDCGKKLLGEEHPLVPMWHERVTTLLMQGAPDVLIDELMSCIDEDTSDTHLAALDALVTYYRHHAARMRYREYREKGLMIGSGVVESAHKHVLQARMKLAGQHWSEHHGRHMVMLRAAYKTAGCQRLHTAINRAVCLTALKRAA